MATIEDKYGEAIEKLGKTADQIDNLMAATQIPMPPQFHLDQLVNSFTELSGEIKELYEKLEGENPWS